MDNQNAERDLALQLVQYTNKNIFLTGKAGTGKTTFLKYVRDKVDKRMVVVAPTGVAAINAGGVTIHSFFQLPPNLYEPGTPIKREAHQLSSDKLNILSTLDLLIIDEISMVRADLLDEIDMALRSTRYRHRQEPFGGVQLLLIGDLQQLPPVLTADEQILFSQYYPSPYFFQSRALLKSNFVCVELQQVYRQTDPTFVSLLNQVRTNSLTAQSLQLLNSRYNPDFNPSNKQAYVRLTTHNKKADDINATKLKALRSKAYTFKAVIRNEFNPNSYPVEKNLVLKKGAQVMFVKNDNCNHLYYNGKIGEVSQLSEDYIEVVFPDKTACEVLKETWSNSRFKIDEKTKEISMEEIGSFSQYPLRLAWAFTIHKSQGLTFDKMIVDGAHSFAHGQVYVALSRCRSLDGLVLSSQLTPQSVICDPLVTAFNQSLPSRKPGPKALSSLKKEYYLYQLKDQFSFISAKPELDTLLHLFADNLSKQFPKQLFDLEKFIDVFQSSVVSVSETFQQQIENLFQANDEALPLRVKKGSVYFLHFLSSQFKPLLQNLNVEIGNAEVNKKVNSCLQSLSRFFFVKFKTLSLLGEAPFSVPGYLKAKSQAFFSTNSTLESSSTSKKLSASISGIYPDFLIALSQFRQSLADKCKCKPSELMSPDFLMAVVRCRPTSKSDISFLKGWNAQYENDIFEGINTLAVKEDLFQKKCRAQAKISQLSQLYAQTETLPPDDAPPITPTLNATLDLVKQKIFDPQKMAEQRKLSLSTIYLHLCKLVAFYHVPVSYFVESEVINQVTDFKIHHQEMNSLTQIKEGLNNQVDFNTIKLVLASVESSNNVNKN